MICETLGILPHGDMRRFAWAGLGRLQNVSHVSRLIASLQHPPDDQARNVRKQAEQIRYCVIQAKEYFDAASAVSLATKPVLLYYGIMSLALAEILLKNDGQSSLDYARSEHRRHGLDFRLSENPSRKEALSSSAGAIRAAPLIRQGARIGTFELWHRSARETPLCGESQSFFAAGTSQTFTVIIAQATDERIGEMPVDGRSFLECIRTLPGMAPLLAQHGITPACVRGRLSSVYREFGDSYQGSLIIHPCESALLQELCATVRFDAKCIGKINPIEPPNALVVHFGGPRAEGPVGFQFPGGIQEKADEIHFKTTLSELNEFGIYYAGLFILGNYARYFPDQWMVDVERSSPLALAATEFLSIVENRVPLLSLSELSRIWYLAPA